MKYKYSKAIFIAIFLLMAFLYQYNKILLFRPYSNHQWRQTDCLSLTLNYYKENRPFLDPSVCWIGPHGTGEVISEFPIIYFSVAQLWKIFGQHEFIFRTIIVVILFAGLYYLFRTFEEFLQNSFWAIGLVMLLFTSPIWVFYGNNFLADLPGLSFALIGWFQFMKFYKGEKNKYLFLAMFFFLLGGLIKISSLISFISISGVFLIELIFNQAYAEGRKVFRNPKIQIIPFLIVIAIITIWYSFAKNFNQKHNDDIFLIGTLPIWNFSNERIHFVWNEFTHKLIFSYYSIYMLVFIVFCLGISFIFYKRANKFLLINNVFITVGVISFFLIWYDVFNIHDYYMINLLILPIMTLLNFIVLIKKLNLRLVDSKIIKIIFIFFLSLNIFYASGQNSIRYFPPPENSIFSLVIPEESQKLWRWYHWDYKSFYKAYETIEPYNRSIGIKRTDMVISIPDQSINITLYLMDQKGFTDYFGYKGYNGENRIRKFISMGAKYLFINNKKIYDEAYIQPFIKNKIGKYKNIDIYSLADIKNNLSSQ